ncbi:MAG: SOS response-associated peptidase [Thermaerobacter sp.]|nr:SOS response-associated peptidase [Thermaerobacter sp.]
MCGRFSLALDWAEMERELPFDHDPGPWLPQYNIAPGALVLCVAAAGGQRQGRLVRWGMVPPWAGEQSSGRALINARVETVDRKASFRVGLQTGRCLVPADSYYEWAPGTAPRQPYRIVPVGHTLLWMAGLYQSWDDRRREQRVTGLVILTRSAVPAVAAIHPRMPVILSRELAEQWLSARGSEVDPIVRPPWPDPGPLRAYRVGLAVNRAGQGGRELHAPWADEVT